MEENETKGGRVYELAVLISPRISEEAMPGKFGDLKALIEEKGGVSISEEMPRMIELAYDMSRTIENKKTWFSNAYFGWMKFSGDPSMLSALEETLKHDDILIRYMLIKTVKENTVLGKRPFARGEGYKKRMPEKQEVTGIPLSGEEIDREIDALVEEKV